MNNIFPYKKKPLNFRLTYQSGFYLVLFIALPLYLVLSLKTGISADEYLHYQQSEKVLDYYLSMGKNKAAAEETITHLNHYGQFYDNLVTAIERLFNVENRYVFRHLASAFAGWLVLLISGLLIVKLKGYRAALVGLVILILSPRFLGHSLNNLKDIPFALAYVWFFFGLYQYLVSLPATSLRKLVGLGLSIAFAISIRIGGVILYCYLFFFTLLWMYDLYLNEKIRVPGILKEFAKLTGISVAAYALGLLFWPFANEGMIANPITSFRVMGHFPDIIKEIFEGKQYWSDGLPWYFIPKSMLITIPLGVFAGFIGFFVPLKDAKRESENIFYLFILLGILIPIVFVIVNDSNVYSSWRQLIFVYPLIVIISAVGIEKVVERFRKPVFSWTWIILLSVFFISPVVHMVKNPGLIYCYYNELVGGVKGAYGNYEMDYYGLSVKKASEKLKLLLKDEKNEYNSIVLASNFPHFVNYFDNYDDSMELKTIKYYQRGNTAWDYAIIVNRHIHPLQLQKGLWPPQNTIFTVNASEKAVCAVLERSTKMDFKGYRALIEGKFNQAINYLNEAFTHDQGTESTYINLARAYIYTNQLKKAKQVLESCQKIYPHYDVAVDVKAEIYIQQKNYDKAIFTLKKNIHHNPKYFPSYYKLIHTYIALDDKQTAREYIKQGLKAMPEYREELNKIIGKTK